MQNLMKRGADGKSEASLILPECVLPVGGVTAHEGILRFLSAEFDDFDYVKE